MEPLIFLWKIKLEKLRKFPLKNFRILCGILCYWKPCGKINPKPLSKIFRIDWDLKYFNHVLIFIVWNFYRFRPPNSDRCTELLTGSGFLQTKKTLLRKQFQIITDLGTKDYKKLSYSFYLCVQKENTSWVNVPVVGRVINSLPLKPNSCKIYLT
jgi:hypothetical protein